MYMIMQTTVLNINSLSDFQFEHVYKHYNTFKT